MRNTCLVLAALAALSRRAAIGADAEGSFKRTLRWTLTSRQSRQVLRCARIAPAVVVRATTRSGGHDIESRPPIQQNGKVIRSGAWMEDPEMRRHASIAYALTGPAETRLFAPTPVPGTSTWRVSMVQ